MFFYQRKIFGIVSALLSVLLLGQGVVVSATISDSSTDSFAHNQFYLDTADGYETLNQKTTSDYPLISDNPSFILPNNTTTPTPECHVNTSINPSPWNEEPLGMATDGVHMFIVGYDYTARNKEWRIEKRDFKTGNLAIGFGPNIFNPGVVQVNLGTGRDNAYAIAIDDNAMYVVGADSSLKTNAKQDSNWQWHIEKRSLIDGSLIQGFGDMGNGIININPSQWDDEPLAIAIDKQYMYVAGFDSAPDFMNLQWRIEKRRLDTGALDTTFGANKNGVVTFDATKNWDVIKAIKVDQNAIYVVGYEDLDLIDGLGDAKWRIEKRDIVTGNRIMGFGDNKDGIVISNPSKRDDGPWAMAIDGNFLYAVGFDRAPASGFKTSEWRIEKRALADGKLDPGFGNKGVVKSDPGDQEDLANSIAIDENFMYVAGWDESPPFGFFSEWRIEKRSLKDGLLDGNFYNGGVLRYNPSFYNDAANAIVISGRCFRAAGFDSLGVADHLKNPDMQWRIIGGYK